MVQGGEGIGAEAGKRQGGACCHPGVLVSGRELEAVCRMETDCGGRPRRTWGLTGLGSWRERRRKEEQRGRGVGEAWRLHLGHPSKDDEYGSSGITPGNAWSPVPGTLQWKGHSSWPSPPLRDKLGILGPETPCRVGHSLVQRNGCALACSTKVWGLGGAVEMAEFRELPTPPPPSPGLSGSPGWGSKEEARRPALVLGCGGHPSFGGTGVSGVYSHPSLGLVFGS